MGKDLSTSSTITPLGIADALAPHHEIVIAGPQFGPTLWPPLVASAHRTEPTPSGPGPDFFLRLPRIARSVHADVVIACKPRLPSFGPALLAKLIRRAPIVLYADDDEIAMTLPGRRRSVWRRLCDPSSDIYTRLVLRCLRFADAVIVAASSLRRQLGGDVVPVPRHLPTFDPTLYDRHDLRRRFGVGLDDFVIGFIGNPRSHKGLDDLVEFVTRSALPALRLLIAPPAGFGELHDLRAAAASSGDRVQLIDGHPSELVPQLLAVCDVIPVAQRATAASQAQIPAKLVEAMAMGRAIVATAVSDIPSILEGCGIVVPPERPDLVAEAIERLYHDRTLCATLGDRARARFTTTLSLAALGPRLRALVEKAAGMK